MALVLAEWYEHVRDVLNMYGCDNELVTPRPELSQLLWGSDGGALAPGQEGTVSAPRETRQSLLLSASFRPRRTRGVSSEPQREADDQHGF